MPSPAASAPNAARQRRPRPSRRGGDEASPRPQRSVPLFVRSHLDREEKEMRAEELEERREASGSGSGSDSPQPFPELSEWTGDDDSDDTQPTEANSRSDGSDGEEAQEEGEEEEEEQEGGVSGAGGVRLLAPPDDSLAAQSDSSGDEGETGQELRYKNRVGSVPLDWYRGEAHIGYDASGQRIGRKAQADAIDSFLQRLAGSGSRYSVYDAINDEQVTLSADELASLQRIRHGGYAHIGFDPYADYDQGAFTSVVRHEAIGNPQEPKRRFIPSAWEAKRVVKLVRAMRNGWLRSIEESQTLRARKAEQQQAAFLLWGSDGQLLTPAGEERTGLHRMPASIPPPKLTLPGHAHSYNPPVEYLMSPEEEEAWRQQDPSDRPLDFVPRRYAAMRLIPAYTEYVKERFDRCLDLYLCPRVRRRKLNIDPQSLIPALPKPAELRPFPTQLAVRYIGHTARVRSIAVDSSGEWLASGAEDGSVRLWELSSGRCFKRWSITAEQSAQAAVDGSSTAPPTPPVIEHVSFCPDVQRPLLSVCVGQFVVLLRTGTGSFGVEGELDSLLSLQTAEQREQQDDDDMTGAGQRDDGEGLEDGAATKQKPLRQQAVWRARRETGGEIHGFSVGVPQQAAGDSDSDEVRPQFAPASDSADGGDSVLGAAGDGSRVVLVVDVGHLVTHLTWHHKGDYFATTSKPSSASSHILIHRLSAHASHSPFARQKGAVSCCSFHPTQPFFLLAARSSVLVYHLVRAVLVKRLLTPMQLISSLAVHPSGDHVLVSSYDRKVCWFDLDMGASPYRTLKYHTRAVRRVAFHPTYPLFASAADDGCVHIFHATVYTDLLTNAMLVPLKIIRAHAVTSELGVLDCCWHATQPWLVTAGADHAVTLWSVRGSPCVQLEGRSVKECCEDPRTVGGGDSDSGSAAVEAESAAHLSSASSLPAGPCSAEARLFIYCKREQLDARSRMRGNKALR